MKEVVSAISNKGRVTIPVEVRRHLGVSAPDKIAFVIGDEVKVELRPVRFTLESVLGSIEALLNESIDLDQEIADARETAAAEKMARSNHAEFPGITRWRPTDDSSTRS